MTKERILQAAEQEFITKGFDGARTTSIAAAAGVTHTMLHYYFSTKENLFEQVLVAKVELIWQSIVVPFMAAQGRPLEERLRIIVEEHFRFISQNPGLPRFGLSEVFGQLSRYEYLMARIKENVLPVLRGLQEDIDNAVAQGKAEPIKAETLLGDIIPLNTFLFLAPKAPDHDEARWQKVLDERLEENIKLITRRVLKHI